jgi:hypothetical protein
MANKMFTKRNGKQVPVAEFTQISIPYEAMTSLLRLQEDYALKGQTYSIAGVILDALDKGVYTIRAHWKAAAKNKELRETGKNVREYIRVQLALRKPIDPNVVAELSGMAMPQESVDDSEATLEILDSETADLTDVELEQATAPDGHVS